MRSALLCVLVIAGTTPALASDGVREINQTCAVQTGCFAGDSAGFPVTIASFGSYKLTSNLDVNSDSTDAIEITVGRGDVSIDLNGFTIGGRVFCTGVGGSISCGAGTGRGIDAEGKPRVSVRNGRISDFDVGLIAGDGAQVRDLIIVSHGGPGINVGDGSTVVGSSAFLNEGNGIMTGFGSVVRETTSRENKLSGFLLGARSKLRASAASGNGAPSQCGGGVCSERRRFYLTNSEHTGAQALDACDSGFHMASLWEILDPSNLAYDWRRANAATEADSGQGPPTLFDRLGWVRTGWSSQDAGAIVGINNCNSWTMTTGLGTRVKLHDRWDASTPDIASWDAQDNDCSQTYLSGVWCVEDD
jgi:hypothetical protein